MPYRALYREWRPRNFDHLVGQDHVVTTLKNAVKTGKIAHAYLFSGPRGTGKTSAAKILAKSLNCHEGPTDYPCETCPSCEAHNQGKFMDLIEIDAASNRGIDEIREIRDNVVFSPSEGRYKIYIVDEVHMLTMEAFNALLKTLEEPPEHVVFVLATTEPHKLPTTILSRCQRFDFHKIPLTTIEERLKKVLMEKQLQYEDRSLTVIAQKSDGSLRDALSLLDQCLSYIGEENALKASHIYEILGAVPGETYKKLLESIKGNRLEDVIGIVQQTADSGKDMGQFLNDLILFLRDLVLFKLDRATGQKQGELLQGKHDELRSLSESFTKEELLSMIDFLAEKLNAMKWSQNQRLIVEMSLMRLLSSGNVATVNAQTVNEKTVNAQKEASHAHKENKNQASAAFDKKGGTSRSDREINREEKWAGHPAVDESQKPMEKAKPGTHHANDTQDAQETQDAQSEQTVQDEHEITLEVIQAQWTQIMEKLKQTKVTAHALVKEGTPYDVKGNTFYLGFAPTYRIHKEWVEQKELGTLKKVLQAFFPQIKVKCVLLTEETPASQNGSEKELTQNKTQKEGSATEELKEGAIQEFGPEKVEFFNSTRRDS